MLQLLGNGFSRSEILPYLMRRFGVDQTAARRYLAAALADLRRSAEVQTSFDGLQQVAMLRSLYRDCVRNQDFRAALDALKLLMRLSGTPLLERDGDVLLHIPREPAALPPRRTPVYHVNRSDPVRPPKRRR